MLPAHRGSPKAHQCGHKAPVLVVLGLHCQSPDLGNTCPSSLVATNFRWSVSQTQAFYIANSWMYEQTSSCASSSCELTSHLPDSICFYLQSEKNESDEKQEGNSSGDKEPSSLKQRLAQKRKAEQGKCVCSSTMGREGRAAASLPLPKG